MTMTSELFNYYSAATKNIAARGGRLLIDGEWINARSGGSLPIIDPATGQHIGTLTAGGHSDMNDAVAAAKRAFERDDWSRMAPEKRERLLNKLADLIERDIQQIAELESLDVGMPLPVAQWLVGSSVSTLRYMAGWPSKIEGRTIPLVMPIPGSEFFACTVREPVGVIGAIIPWNAPFMMAVWKIAPALVCGCSIVLKPAEDASLSILALGELIVEAGIPSGVVNIVTGTGKECGEALVRHPDVARITFTGSTVTGRAVATMAAETTKKVSLELGGKSPQIIFADADLDKAIPGVASAVFLNSGQICVAGSRLYVQRRIYSEVVERLSRHASGMKLGHPMDPETHLGPVISQRQHARIEGYLDGARAQGATVSNARAGGLPAGGFYVEPAVVEARQDMSIVREEVFGPVITAIPFDEPEEAITLANDNAYGLASYLWTRDIATALPVASRLKAGKVAVNTAAAPYPSIPEGGRKASGYGRDQGPESIDGCLETKVIVIQTK
jgi:phenylacetaldehyde dehydrogenase